MNHLTFKNGTFIEWNHGDDGGGSTHYHDFLKLISNTGKYNRCLEWCAGCSAIGFSLLDAKIIDELVLMDKYKPALDKALENAKNNNFQNVFIYHLDKIQNLPSTEKFDLIVANPPHVWYEERFLEQTKETWRENGHLDSLTQSDIDTLNRLLVDANLAAHKEFFENIKKYLKNNADIFISETDPSEELMSLIENSGLTILNKHVGEELTKSAGTFAYIFHLRYEEKIC